LNTQTDLTHFDILLFEPDYDDNEEFKSDTIEWDDPDTPFYVDKE